MAVPSDLGSLSEADREWLLRKDAFGIAFQVAALTAVTERTGVSSIERIRAMADTVLVELRRYAAGGA